MQVRLEKEHRIMDYSTWLQWMMENTKNWAKVQSRHQDAKVCEKLGDRKVALSKFVNSSLSLIQEH
jgi:hypothetical protein